MDYKKEFKRLLEIVKNHRKANNLPSRNEDIAKILGYERTYLSSLMGDKGKVTEDHINTLKLHFPNLSENHTFQTEGKNDLHTLIESNARAIGVCETAVNTNARLTEMLAEERNRTTAGFGLKNLRVDDERLSRFLAIVAQIGAQGPKRLWKDTETGMFELGKLFGDTTQGKKAKDIQNGEHKNHKTTA